MMPRFVYEARKSPREKVRGTVEAESLPRAVRKITAMGYAPIRVRPQPSKVRSIEERTKASGVLAGRGRMSSERVAAFTRQMHDLIDANVPILRALRLTAAQGPDGALKEVLRDMTRCVEQGGRLSEAAARHPGAFSRLYVGMIRVGEQSSRLGEVLGRLAEMMERDQEIRAKVKAALFYPALILAAGGLTVGVLMVVVIPRLSVMFDDLGQVLPWPTRVLMGLSALCARFWWVGLIVGGGAVLEGRRRRRQGRRRLGIETLLLKAPVWGRLISDVEIARFARTLGTLLQSGVVIGEALEHAGGVMGPEVFRREIRAVAGRVRKGERLSQALAACSFLPEGTVSMMAVGEETGDFERSLDKLAAIHERRADRAMKTLTTVMEPALILGIGLVVGFVVIAMMLPLFQVNLILP